MMKQILFLKTQTTSTLQPNLAFDNSSNQGRDDTKPQFCIKNADHNWNIEEIDCADGEYDVIVCSHILEHVNTKKALAELYRVLRPSGVALLMVPICEGLDHTYENDGITTEQGRWAHFQQHDHTRVLGRDFRQMIRDAEFQLDEYVAEGETVIRHGLVMGERVFVAKKRGNQ